jgi:hypothetical protein
VFLGFDCGSRAATRIETDVYRRGTYGHSGYRHIDDFFQQEAGERELPSREALLHQIQWLMRERVMHASIYKPAPLHGVPPRCG